MGNGVYRHLHRPGSTIPHSSLHREWFWWASWLYTTLQHHSQSHRIRGAAMMMTPGLRKFALTLHVTSSVGWFGAVAGFLALAVAGVTSQDAVTVRTAYLAME